MSTEESRQIAETILQQLGGNNFTFMTGAKNFLYGVSEKTSNAFISFQFPMCRRVNRCHVELMPDDTYYVRFGKYNGRTLDYTIGCEFEGVYADMLQDVFTSHTGLETRMPTFRNAKVRS